ncbi:MAG: SCO family protein [Gammaproteobacteria bacterium]
MTKGVARTVIVCVAFMALLVGLLVHRILSPTVMSNAQLAENGLFVYDLPRAVTPFALTDHEGAPFTQERLSGKWTLLFFGYTFCPDICPVTLATIRQFEQLLEEADPEAAAQLQVAMISVDPQRDTPDKLAAYMSYFNPAYIGATGEYIDVFNLGRQLNVAFGYTPMENGEYLVNHSGEILLINPRGEFHGFFKIPHDPEKMLRNFRSVYASW